MKKITFIILLLATLTIFVQAQPCASVSSNLKIRDFKLGMTETEAKRRYPNVQIYSREDGSGLSTVNMSINLYEAFTEQERKGLSEINLKFLDKNLAVIGIVYDGFTEWNSVSEFTDASAKQLNLPLSSSWQTVDKNTFRLNCKDFFIISNLEPKAGRYSLQVPSLILSIIDFDNIMKQREDTKTERQKKVFKP